MRIKEILVQKLFGIFDHTIPLNADDRITIIHGPNGFGKTIILKILYGLFNRRYSELLAIPFERFEARFDDDTFIRVNKSYVKTKRDSEVENNQLRLLSGQDRERISKVMLWRSKTDGLGPQRFSLSSLYSPTNLRVPTSVIEREIPELDRVGPNEWLYLPTGENLSIYDVLERFGDFLIDRFNLPIPDWWLEVQELIDIRFIQTQRLQSIRSPGLVSRARIIGRRPIVSPTVNEFSEELAETIQQKLAESASLSQSLDRSFPKRLVERMRSVDRSSLTDDELGTRLGELDGKRSRLIEVGLLDKEEGVASLPIGGIAGDTKDVLAVYVQDVEKKLEIFDDIASKIELLKRMINKRFLYKELSISRKEGFIFLTPDGEKLPLNALSSGEQHELVLLYQLLFKASANSLILIDEPEISLHIAWQQEFLHDLQEIAKLSLFDVLIATHSPQIIHDRWDLTVRLEGPTI